MVFSIEKVLKIWDLVIIDNNMIICFGAAIMIDLKDKLMLMNLSDCMSCIRNLEGIVDLDFCLYYSAFICQKLSSSFFSLNYSQEEDQNYDTPFYKERPWEIPLEFHILECRSLVYISVFDLMAFNEPIIVDIRNQTEFFFFLKL